MAPHPRADLRPPRQVCWPRMPAPCDLHPAHACFVATHLSQCAMLTYPTAPRGIHARPSAAAAVLLAPFRYLPRPLPAASSMFRHRHRVCMSAALLISPAGGVSTTALSLALARCFIVSPAQVAGPSVGEVAILSDGATLLAVRCSLTRDIRRRAQQLAGKTSLEAVRHWRPMGRGNLGLCW